MLPEQVFDVGDVGVHLGQAVLPMLGNSTPGQHEPVGVHARGQLHDVPPGGGRLRDVFERPGQPSGLAGDVEEFEVRPGGQLLGVIRCQVGQNAQVQFRGAELGAGRFTEGLFGLCERCQRLPASQWSRSAI